MLSETHDIMPIKLAPERAWRTYLGGSLLDRLHGKDGADDSHFPEEWIMSVVVARNAGRENIVEGPSRLADAPDVTLKDRIAANPEALLGRRHVRARGPTPGVLVKLLDSAERLTIQSHPDTIQAKKFFASEYGKTECWHILGGRSIGGETPRIYLGFKEGVTREGWRDLFLRQDIPGMLAALHSFEVAKGETILIEGGAPHAIGAGCLLAEIQEPTDYTIRVERVTPAGFPVADAMCHQGLGFEAMFEFFNYEGLPRAEAKKRWFIQPTPLAEDRGGAIQSLITHQRCPCFRLDRIEVRESVALPAAGIFSGLYALEGKGHLYCGGMRYPLAQGDQYFLPAALAEVELRNDADSPLVLLRFFGPK